GACDRDAAVFFSAVETLQLQREAWVPDVHHPGSSGHKKNLAGALPRGLVYRLLSHHKLLSQLGYRAHAPRTEEEELPTFDGPGPSWQPSPENRE
ncbi:MAG: hypothetical protein VYB15_08835, partial [Planctomycetota bacterium]|nr:hypothetical protein [Planctomycetota bacterium]